MNRSYILLISPLSYTLNYCSLYFRRSLSKHGLIISCLKFLPSCSAWSVSNSIIISYSLYDSNTSFLSSNHRLITFLHTSIIIQTYFIIPLTFSHPINQQINLAIPAKPHPSGQKITSAWTWTTETGSNQVLTKAETL